ncbi:non-canonical purine NTP pyrophosphatase [bacterium]|nr:non-canonical purine NTP pyrophosphatase [bacterium]
MYFVTSNDNKLKEYQEILGIKLERANLDLPEIQAINIEDVSRYKVLNAYRELNCPVFVEDTGLFLRDMGGLPGALVKHFIDNISLQKMCKLVDSNRCATAKVCLAYCKNGKDVKLFVGQTEGIISAEPKGGNGFGWDSIFIPSGSKKTFAEMKSEEKNKYMRAEAAQKFKEYLKRKR